jgi:hypothetical protein
LDDLLFLELGFDAECYIPLSKNDKSRESISKTDKFKKTTDYITIFCAEVRCMSSRIPV